MTEFCACGRVLHYENPAIERFVQDSITRWGPTLDVVTLTTTWHVPRHFAALHGIDLALLPRLARRFHWRKEQHSYAPHASQPQHAGAGA